MSTPLDDESYLWVDLIDEDTLELEACGGETMWIRKDQFLRLQEFVKEFFDWKETR